MADVDGAHGREQLRRRRELAGMTIAEVAARAGVASSRLADVEEGMGLACDLPRVGGVGARHPAARPDWWDEGHEHDLGLGRQRRGAPATEGLRRYREHVEGESARRSRSTTGVVGPPPPDPDRQLAAVCRALNRFGVA